MPGIPSVVYSRLEDVLSRCGPFSSSATLRAIFVDLRLNAWHNELPNANSTAERIRLTIDYLSEQYNTKGENALVLLLKVLSDRKSSDDVCHQQLIKLVSELENCIAPMSKKSKVKRSEYKNNLSIIKVIMSVFLFSVLLISAYAILIKMTVYSSAKRSTEALDGW